TNSLSAGTPPFSNHRTPLSSIAHMTSPAKIGHLKYGMHEIIGKRIRGVFVRHRKDEPKGQILLAFDDGTAYEFYCPLGAIFNIGTCRKINMVDVAHYMADELISEFSAVENPNEPDKITVRMFDKEYGLDNVLSELKSIGNL
ncbi:MAG: hypothetical protein ACREAN_04375, partial [Nitrosopumilaceae archaeon]